MTLHLGATLELFGLKDYTPVWTPQLVEVPTMHTNFASRLLVQAVHHGSFS